jgi:hypothetical protein
MHQAVFTEGVDTGREGIRRADQERHFPLALNRDTTSEPTVPAGPAGRVGEPTRAQLLAKACNMD